MATYLSAATFMYFAYGSNLLRERIQIKNPTARFHGLGKLQGYKFTYDVSAELVGCYTDFWMGATATIRPSCLEDCVWGVIWEIGMEDLENLDIQEKYYHPLEVDVILENGQLIKCRTYEMDADTLNDRKPSPYYKKIVIAGARQNGLPEEYIQFLEGFPDNGVTEIPPLYQNVLEAVRNFRCQIVNERCHALANEYHILDTL